MFNLILLALAGLTCMWILIVLAMPDKMKLFLARRQWLFLLLHIPVMMLFTTIGGEGLVFGVSSLCAGLVGQCFLAFWGKRKHHLTMTGKRTPAYYKLHPKKKRRIRRAAARSASR
jgi:hypothetical protein